MTLLNEQGSSRGLGSLALERRLAEITARLERAAVANPELPAGTVARSGGTPPRVSGLTPALAPGQVVWSWNAASVTDLRYYELQVSTDIGFEQDVTTYTTGVRTQATPLTAGTTHYARVRAVNQAGNPGGWSSTEDSLPGTVSTLGLDESAASALYRYEQSSGFRALTSAAAAAGATYTDSDTYGPLTITVLDDSAIVMPRVTFTIALDLSYGAFTDTNPLLSFTVELLRDGEVIDDAVYDIQSSTDADELSIPSFATYDQPGAGTFDYEYRVRIETFTTDGSTLMTLTPSNVVMEFIQNKR